MELQKHYSDFRELGAELYTISVDKPAVSKAFFVGEHAVEFPVLSDQSLETIRAYGVHDRIFKKIAKPSAFVIDKSGIIRWKFIGDTTTRANIDIMLLELETLNLETPKSFSLSVPAGTSMVHLPRLDTELNGESRSITKVSDLFCGVRRGKQRALVDYHASADARRNRAVSSILRAFGRRHFRQCCHSTVHGNTRLLKECYVH